MQRPLESVYQHLKNQRNSIKDLKNFVRASEDDAPVVMHQKTIIREKMMPIYEENQIQLQLAWTLQLMLRDLNDLISIRAAAFKANECQMNPSAVIKSVIDRYGTEVRNKRINMRTFLDNVNRVVHLDQQRFIQVFTALLQNALKFTNHGEIVVEAKIRDGEDTVSNNSQHLTANKACEFVIFVQVSDTGCGMRHDIRDNIFAPLSLGEAVNSHSHGYSLYIAREITR